MSVLTISSTVKLNSGHSMPLLGLGVYRTSGSVISEVVHTALKAGYRHFDSAQMYQNEAELGSAIRAAGQTLGIPRSQVFATSKTTASDAASAVEQSLSASNLDYWDLYLIHSPSGGPEHRERAWRGLEKKMKEGKVKSIGVSNYGVRHLEEIRQNGLTMPAVNQIELHPWLQQRDIVDYCRKNGIVVQAYCPLVRGTKANDRTLTKIAQKHDVSWAQVLIRWSLQNGFVPLPKSDKPHRIESNADVYAWSLDEEEMRELNALDQGPAATVSWYRTLIDAA